MSCPHPPAADAGAPRTHIAGWLPDGRTPELLPRRHELFWPSGVMLTQLELPPGVTSSHVHQSDQGRMPHRVHRPPPRSCPDDLADALQWRTAALRALRTATAQRLTLEAPLGPAGERGFCVSRTNATAVGWTMRHMTIKARLKGGITDLEMLEVLFPGDPGVALDDTGHYLWGSVLERANEDGVWLHEIAKPLLDLMQGMAKIQAPIYNDEGVKIESWEGAVVGTRMRIFGVSSFSWDKEAARASLDSTLSTQAVAMAATDERVRRVIEFHSQLDYFPSWVVLFKIFEIIRRDVGARLVNEWGGATNISTFTETAQRRERHAEVKAAPSGRTMTPAEARQLIRDLTTRWLKLKTATA